MAKEGQWDNLFARNEKYLADYQIKDKASLEKTCLEGYGKSLFFRSTSFYERACSLSLEEIIGKKFKKREPQDFLKISNRKMTNIKKKIKSLTNTEIKNADDLINWCKANVDKPYSNKTKWLEENLMLLCFKK